jgi:tellurium resistance protein TerD
MPINLTKGQVVDLRKSAHDLDRITIGLGWKVKEKQSHGAGNAPGAMNDADFDLDAIAFLLDERDKVADRGDSKLVGGDVVFFNSRAHPSGTVIHSGDNRTGGTGETDDEQIVVLLNSVPSQYRRILFLVCIYQGSKLGQHFGQIGSAYIRAVDGRGTEIVRYSLNSDPAYEGQCTVVLGEVYRQNEGWRFRALGDAYPYDSFAYLLKGYLPA